MGNKQIEIIENYIEGYNEFDIEKMVSDFSKNIIFEDIQNDKVTLMLQGIKAFRQQAELAMTYFETRKQKIITINTRNNRVEIEIDYSATLAVDFPNGMKKGDKLELKGKSIFVFLDNKIVKLTDQSG